MSLYNFYRSKEWCLLLVVLRHERLNERGELTCEHCGKPITRAYDCIGHHKIHLTEENYLDAEISLNPDNIALVHHKCHNMIHNKLGYSQREVFLVWGAPLSGKTSYVKDNALPGDLIVDIDSIWECLSGQDRYIKPGRLNANVFGVRDLLLDQIRTRTGKWSNAYVVGGYPLQAERERLLGTLGAREVFIECSEEECRERLLECEDRDIEVWGGYITDWFAKYQGSW